MPKPPAKYRRVTFRVTTAAALPAGEQIFVSGNVPELGDWAEDALPLSRVDDRVWSAVVDLPGDEPVEFKLTRGTWETEEARRGALPWPNHTLKAGPARTLKLKVSGWRDG